MNRRLAFFLIALPLPAHANDLTWLAGMSVTALIVHLLLTIPLFRQQYRRPLLVGLYLSSVVAVWLAIVFTDAIEAFYLVAAPILLLVILLAISRLKQRAVDTATK